MGVVDISFAALPTRADALQAAWRAFDVLERRQHRLGLFARRDAEASGDQGVGRLERAGERKADVKAATPGPDPQALAFGDRRPYVVALLTLDGEAAPAWARAHGVEADSVAALATSPAVLTAVAEAVSAANERLARVQQVKQWRLLPVEWTAET